jgi:hypothetical protein
MRYAVWALVAGLAVAALVSCQPQGVKQGPEKPRASGTGSKASEPLLLLDDGEKKSPGSAGPVADNGRCFVCHLNYVQESIAVVHAKANISCAKCHGDCDAHIADESWASGGNGTAPGIMYPREKVNLFCMGCHPKDKMSVALHAAFLAGTAKEASCTDCHGKHRLATRKCKWK